MKKSNLIATAVAVLMCGSTAALAADKASPAKHVDTGQREFKERCVVCHGSDATGSGSYVELLKKAPPDLTTLSKRNGGVFPFDRVYAVIDGRQVVKAHGDRDMPIWGQRYTEEGARAGEYYVDVPYDMEMYARARILALIDYLHRLQKK